MINRRSFLSLAGVVPIGRSLKEITSPTGVASVSIASVPKPWTPVSAFDLARQGFERLEWAYADLFN